MFNQLKRLWNMPKRLDEIDRKQDELFRKNREAALQLKKIDAKINGIQYAIKLIKEGKK